MIRKNNLSLYLGRENIEGAVTTFDGNVQLFKQWPYSSTDSNDIFQQIQQAALEIIDLNKGIGDLLSCGVVIPDLEDEIITPENIAGSLLFKTGLESYVNIEAQAEALAELFFGNGRNYNDFVFLSLNESPTGTIFIDRQMYLGNGLAGDFAHLTIHPHGRICKCGKQGCFEKYIGQKGVVSTTENYLQDIENGSQLLELCNNQIERLTIKDIIKAAENRDRAAQDALNDIIDDLSIALANIKNILAPDAIIIKGIGSQNNILFNKLNLEPNIPKIVPAVFDGKNILKATAVSAININVGRNDDEQNNE